MNEFETVIAQTLRRLREIESSSRELADALPEGNTRKQELLQDADRAKEAVKDVSAMYRQCMIN